MLIKQIKKRGCFKENLFYLEQKGIYTGFLIQIISFYELSMNIYDFFKSISNFIVI